MQKKFLFQIGISNFLLLLFAASFYVHLYAKPNYQFINEFPITKFITEPMGTMLVWGSEVPFISLLIGFLIFRERKWKWTLSLYFCMSLIAIFVGYLFDYGFDSTQIRNELYRWGAAKLISEYIQGMWFYLLLFSPNLIFLSLTQALLAQIKRSNKCVTQ